MLCRVWGRQSSETSVTKTTHTFQRLLHTGGKSAEVYIKALYGDVSAEVTLQAGLSILFSPNTRKYGVHKLQENMFCFNF